jgi:CheY-like chemotaxis protein
MLLGKLGYDILIAHDGLDALQLLEQQAQKGAEQQVQVILMDATMDRVRTNNTHALTHAQIWRRRAENRASSCRVRGCPLLSLLLPLLFFFF